MWFWFENKNNNHEIFFLIRRNVRTQSWIIKNKQQATKSENCIFHEVQRQRQRQPQKGRNILDFPMSFTTLLVGGSLGFAAQCSSNAIQKIPISRRKFFLPHMRNWYSFDARLCLCFFLPSLLPSVLIIVDTKYWSFLFFVRFKMCIFSRTMDAFTLHTRWGDGS